MTGEVGTDLERVGRRTRAAGSGDAADCSRPRPPAPFRPGPPVALVRPFAGALAAALACVAMAAMAASAWAQDEHPIGPLTNPVIEDSSGNPVSSSIAFHSDSLILTAEDPDQGPFDCVVDIEGTINSAGDVTVNVVDIGQGDPQCGTGVQIPPFSLPWPAHVCLEENGGGDYTAWLHLNIVELATPLQSYGSNNPNPGNENLWMRLTPSEEPLPVGPIVDAHVHDSIPGVSSGFLRIWGDFDVITEIPLFVDDAGGTCS